MLNVQEIAEAVAELQQERNDLFDLLRQVAGSVIDPAPNGLSVAYLSAETLAEIRRRVHA